jgi:NADH dehydrogenase [ubiquinone] 1 alpha subcomplex assembly factor 6
MTVDDFTAHAEATTASLHHLLLALLHLGGAPAAAPLSQPHVHTAGHDPAALAHAASHLGVAGAIATRLRALPFHAARRRSVLPAELAAGRVRDEDLFRLGGDAPGVRDAVYAFACVAHAHLGAARETFEVDGAAGRVPARALPVFMAGVPVAAFLARLEAANFDAFAPALARRNWRLPWQMWRASYSRQF